MASTKKSRKQKSAQDTQGQPDPRAPLDSQAFLAAAKPVLVRLEANIVARAKASPEVSRALAARYEAEKAANRTAEHLAGWTAALATQVAASWLLSCVFVRTLEDRELLSRARLAGPGAEDSQRQFFQLAPSLTERDYLLFVFRELAHHPAAKDLFDAEHSLVWKLSPSAEVAKELLALFRVPSASEPAFRFGQASTRFLGDLYQDLSEDVRKRYALLQTPDFVESYILDRTLEPAITRFGLDDTTLIDPTCGSGHFLLGSFDRLFEHRLRTQPNIEPRAAAVKALDGVYGADINPFAIAIARFRLTLAFLDRAGYAKLADAPVLPLHLVVADSLQINPQHAQQELWQHAGEAGYWLGNVFAFDDERAARDVLGRQYSAVVGNPPYITVKDAALREVYRAMYVAASGKYALSAPFCERIFQLARPRGYTGQITSNSFTKREFGKRLIEEVLPMVNLEFIVNTSGAYIPGHGTPTVLLFGTNEIRQGNDVHAVLAKRGEPSIPEDPSQGLVWRSIADHGNQIDFENEYLSVAKVSCDALAKHPWSLGGGGASELKDLLDERAEKRLGDVAANVGISCVTGEDEVFLISPEVARRLKIGRTRPLVTGEFIRDWSLEAAGEVVFPYDGNLERLPPSALESELKYLWPYRASISKRKRFGVPMLERGLTWYELQELYVDKLRAPLTIAFAEVATHNHFALDRGGKIFKQTAPIIKLPMGASEDDYLALLAYLNSSTACFWLKQACMNKGGSGIGRGIQDEGWESRYQFDGTKLGTLPLYQSERFVVLGHKLRDLAEARQHLGAERVLASVEAESIDQLNLLLRMEYDAEGKLLAEMVAVQEEIDWVAYEAAGLLQPGIGQAGQASSSVLPGGRAFEYRLLRESPQTQWFVRNRYQTPDSVSKPPIEVAHRLQAMAEVSEIALIEQPEYKRRWSVRDGDAETRAAAREWLGAGIEKMFDAGEILPVRMLSERLSRKQRGRAVVALIGEMADAVRSVLAAESVGFLSVTRFTEAGVEKYAQWCVLWAMQRRDERCSYPVVVPPKYDKTDYVDDVSWRLRGKLDVPNERFVSYPCCESDSDGQPVYGWAGWDHLQRTQALAALYLKRKDGEGWTAARLKPMLAGLLELIPWINQWHNEPSAEFDGLRMGDFYAQLLDGECRQHGLSHDDLRAWRPPAKTRKAKAAKSAVDDSDDVGDEPVPKRPGAKRKSKATVEEPSAAPEAE